MLCRRVWRSYMRLESWLGKRNHFRGWTWQVIHWMTVRRLGWSSGNLEKKIKTGIWSTHDLPNFYGPHQQTAGAVMSVCYFVWLSSYNDLVQMFQQNVPFRQGRPHEVTNKLLSLCAAVNFVWRSKKTQDCMCTSQTVNNVTIPYWNHMYRNIHTESRKINFFKKKKESRKINISMAGVSAYASAELYFQQLHIFDYAPSDFLKWR